MKLNTLSLALLLMSIGCTINARMDAATAARRPTMMNKTSSMPMKPMVRRVTIMNNSGHDLAKVRVAFNFKVEKNDIDANKKMIEGSVVKSDIKNGEAVTFYADEAVHGKKGAQVNVMKSVEGVQDITLAAIHAGRLHQRFKKGSHAMMFKVLRKNRMDMLEKVKNNPTMAAQ